MTSMAKQLVLAGSCPVTDAVEKMANDSGIEERGAVYTRREVVDFILDLVGYTVEHPLLDYKLLEPSFGRGDFLLPALERLLEVAKKAPENLNAERLESAICGVELHRKTFSSTQEEVRRMLTDHGLGNEEINHIIEKWLFQGDFLLGDFRDQFSHVVGNPPYLRQESVPNVLMNEYRTRFATIYDRADIYVPFIEQSLRSLEPNGRLGFICSDRWMKNKYGKKLRDLVSKNFSLSAYIDMVETDAFHSKVSAYPAITVIEQGHRSGTRVYAKPSINNRFLKYLAGEIISPKLAKHSIVKEVRSVTSDADPWVLSSFDELALVRRLESQFPLLEDVGCRVGIGVATGADKAFIGDYSELDVESCRKLPLVGTRDILDGQVRWRGKGIINPFDARGTLVQLDDYPKLCKYLEDHRTQIVRRHVAKKSPRNWYRTIDRIYPDLTWQEKLLIPDIKGEASIVYEEGKLYPHHNLYFITSKGWDLRSLMFVLRSGIARLFVSLYSTRMRGGYLRYQAQYLRKLRVPYWHDVGFELRQEIEHAVEHSDPEISIKLVAKLYNLKAAELKLIERTVSNES